jgi:hypothetical protein
VTISGFTLTGADAANYNLQQPPSSKADILKAELSISGVMVENKTYDGSTSAMVSGQAFVTPIPRDSVILINKGVGQFSDSNEGGRKPVQIYGFSLTGPDADNYLLIQPQNITASIVLPAERFVVKPFTPTSVSVNVSNQSGSGDKIELPRSGNTTISNISVTAGSGGEGSSPESDGTQR